MAVIGCYAQLKPNDIVAIGGVDIVLGTEEKFNLLQHLDQVDLNGGTTVIQSAVDRVKQFKRSYSFGERTRSFLKIQDGCDYTCSFCTIPLARGASRSDTIANTMKVARELAATVTREIFKGGKANDLQGDIINVSWKVMDDLEDVVRFSTQDMERMKAETGDLVYVADKRKWLGGLKSIHSMFGKPHNEPGVIYLTPDQAQGGLFVEGRKLTAKKEM